MFVRKWRVLQRVLDLNSAKDAIHNSELNRNLNAETAAWPGFNALRHLFIFGDSYSSVGFAPNLPPPKHINAKKTLPFRGNTYADEDGTNWVGYLLAKHDPHAEIVVHDYAAGGCCVPNSDTKPSSVQRQVEEYFLNGYAMSPQEGEPGRSWKSEEALFVTWVGINDCAHGLDHRTTLDLLFSLQEQLYTAGARLFLFIDIPPIARSPAGLKAAKNNAHKDPAASYHAWNASLRTHVECFAQSHPDARVLVFSAFETFNRILDNPRRYYLNPKDVDRPRGEIWRDLLHPTTPPKAVLPPMRTHNRDLFYRTLAQSILPGPDRPAQVAKLIDEARANLATAESKLHALEAVCAHERACIAALYFSLSSVWMVPAEVLAEIFLEAMYADVDAHGLSQWRTATRLASVCTQWRDVALDTPRLWAFPIHLSVQKRLNGSPQVLQDIMARSAPHPIPRVVFTLPYGATWHAVCEATVKAALSSVSRWKDFAVEGIDLPSFLDNVLPSPLPQLMRLQLRCEREQCNPYAMARETMAAAPIPFFAAAPRLRVLFLQTSDVSRCVFPWGQLTKLELTNDKVPAGSALLDTLAACTSLVSLTLDVYPWSEEDDLDGPIASLPALTSIVLRESGEGEARAHHIQSPTLAPFFARFAFPTLDSLELSMSGDTSTDVGDVEFPSFLSRCPRLEYLEITACEMDPATLRDIVRGENVPALKTLYLECCWKCVRDDIFAALTYTGGVASAPRLESVILNGVGDRYGHEAIQGMVASRWWADAGARPAGTRVARLERVDIRATDSGREPPMSDEFRAFMEQVRAEGLEFVVGNDLVHSHY
ncbi:Glycosyltransferase family 32 protein [Mycena kentingensis (nom. inval.)]|nr:Glycosyltransferase family 32 protein [Mycena kentingensis (nom. inval.)]